jgi:hypothetical protein
VNYRFLAKVVAVLHWAWVFILGGCIMLAGIYPGMLPYIWAFIAATALSQAIWRTCPLTVLQDALLVKAGEERPANRSFISRWVQRRFGVYVPPWVVSLQLVTVMLLCLLVAWLVTLLRS